MYSLKSRSVPVRDFADMTHRNFRISLCPKFIPRRILAEWEEKKTTADVVAHIVVAHLNLDILLSESAGAPLFDKLVLEKCGAHNRITDIIRAGVSLIEYEEMHPRRDSDLYIKALLRTMHLFSSTAEQEQLWHPLCGKYEYDYTKTPQLIQNEAVEVKCFEDRWAQKPPNVTDTPFAYPSLLNSILKSVGTFFSNLFGRSHEQEAKN